MYIENFGAVPITNSNKTMKSKLIKTILIGAFIVSTGTVFASDECSYTYAVPAGPWEPINNTGDGIYTRSAPDCKDTNNRKECFDSGTQIPCGEVVSTFGTTYNTYVDDKYDEDCNEGS